MINHTEEALRPLRELDFHREISIQSIMRYILKGMKSVDGKYIQLEATKIGSGWYSSQEAVERLIVAINTPPTKQFAKTSSQRAAQNEAAKRVLETAGV